VKIRALLGWFRRRCEAFSFLCLLILLVPATCAACIVSLARQNRWANVRRLLVVSLRRWVRFLRVGLRDLRTFWWVQFSLESAWDIWRHIILLEWVSIRNMADFSPPAWAGGLRDAPRILFLKFSHYGDAMHIVPMLRSIRQQRPNARIDLLAGPWCKDLATRIRYLDEFISYTPAFVVFNRGDKSSCRRLWSELQFLKMLRRRNYDVVISTATTNLPEWLIIHAADPSAWVGVSGPSVEYTTRATALVEAYHSRQYEAERVSGLLKHVGLEPGASTLEYHVREEELSWAKARLLEQGLSGDRIIVTMAPGSGWPGKNWPSERFAELADWLFEEYAAGIVLIGATAERELGMAMQRSAKAPLVNMIGRTGWGEAAALLRHSHLLVTNDSAPLHLAAALNIATVSLFGPTAAGKWAPPGSCHVHLQHPETCSGCWYWHAGAKCWNDNACMKAISLEEVKHAIASLPIRHFQVPKAV